MIGVVLLAACISVSAVSAEDNGWSFSFSSSDSTNSDGGSVQLDNNVLTIQGFKFTIPEGFVENETAKVVGEDYNASQGLKISTDAFDKGDERILISVIFGSAELDDDTYTPTATATAKKLADEDGWVDEYDGGVAFDYIEDGKLVHVFAPDEKTLVSLLQSSHD